MRSLPRQVRRGAAALALAVFLLAGVWLGGHPEHLPGFLRSTFVVDQQTRVVDEAIRRIARDYYRPISPARLANSSISGLVASLNDRFSHYLTPAEFREFNAPPHFTGIGVAVGPEHRGLLIARVFDSSPAEQAGLKAGEVILAVNGRPLAGLKADAAAALIKGMPGTSVRLEIESPHRPGKRHGARRMLRITRATIDEPVVASLTRTVAGKRFGVIGLATFSPGAHGELQEAVERERQQHVRGLVLDLRSNGGGLVTEAQLIASLFIRRGLIVSMHGRSQPSQRLYATGGAIVPALPMVVLVDANTASAAEIVTAALQDRHRARVVGTHTFGKGVFQEEEALSNGGALDITVGEYFTPSGRNLGGGGVRQGAGITPEVKVAHGVDAPRGLDIALRTLAAEAR